MAGTAVPLDRARGSGACLATLRGARDLMARRGPDDVGERYVADEALRHVWLGHRRLAIQDLTPAGAQPMASDCGRYEIVFNGEIYNAPELRGVLQQAGRGFSSTSDTEVIVTGFAEWGPAIVDRLVGMFAFVIYDRQASALFAARDRVGIKPLQYVATEGGIAFASDVRALKHLGLIQSVDRQALGVYLLLGYVPTPHSIWRGAARLPAGCCLSWSAAEPHPRIRQYWAPPDDLDTESSRSVEAFEALLDRVIEDHLLADVPVGTFLSGGLDSSLVASSISRLPRDRRPDSLTAMTVAYSESRADNEAPIARRTAECLGLDWREVGLDASNAAGAHEEAFRALDEPLSFNAVVSQIAIASAGAREFKVVLTGDGGDEVLGGYRWYESLEDFTRPASALDDLTTFARKRRWDAVRIRRFESRSLYHRQMRRVTRGFLPGEVADLLGPEMRHCEDAAVEALRRHDAPRLPLKRRLQRIDLMTFCQDVVLPKVDKATMHYSLEARPPLLDHRLVEWGLSAPLSAQLDDQPKGLLRQILARRGLGFLLDEPKRGFSLKSSNPYSEGDMLERIAAAAPDLGLAPRWRDLVRPGRIAAETKMRNLLFLSAWFTANLRGSPV
ncbi:MAG: asparagine synthase (glutamine-hydrolyzing) [Alphaproteobacteria bacterium]|nr:asparagine synthase (glutamine-hydrolyzing) [Alphaproteobacteria bacterium]